MSKSLNLSELESLVNEQNTEDFELGMLQYSEDTQTMKNDSPCLSLISPEDLGIQSSELNVEDKIVFCEDSVSILLPTENVDVMCGSRQVLSPLPVFENLSDNSDDDPDWAPDISRRRRPLYPRQRSLSSDDSQLTVQDLHRNTHLFLRKRRRIFSFSESDENIEPNVAHVRKELPCTVKRNKAARVAGKPYLGYKKMSDKWIPCVEKPERILKSRCLHTNTTYKSKNSFLCGLVSDDERKHIHEKFWGLKTWAEKIAFIKTSAVRRCIRRRRKSQQTSLSKKQSGHDIYLNKSDANCTRVRVCRQFFLNTICIGEDSFRRWTRDTDNLNEESTEQDNLQLEATSSTVCPRRNSELKKTVKTWLDILPKVPSHYCRSTTTKIYVESTFRSTLHMHQVYKEWCIENNYRAASRMVFTRVLAQERIGIHQPRKDQCDTCCSYKTGNISQQEYENHIKKKNEAREAKKNAIDSADEETIVITVDVQSVLLAPKLLASSLYYKMKLQCHNFTVYNAISKEVTIYFWHEADGNVTANEFTSCLINYCQNLPTSMKRIIIISDGCAHQNRNRILSSALSDLAQNKKINIEQLYLEKGHTMMEVDSVHSTIEQYIKPPIYSPSDYITRMRQARPQQPYDVKSIHFDFFLNYEELESNLKSIRPGKKKGDPVVVDIRGLKYSPDRSIFYRLRHIDQWTILPQRRCNQGILVPNRLYMTPLKITESKFKHLQELKTVVDRDYHPFYDSLAYNPGT